MASGQGLVALVDGPSFDIRVKIDFGWWIKCTTQKSARSVQFPERNHSLSVLFLSGWSERASYLPSVLARKTESGAVSCSVLAGFG